MNKYFYFLLVCLSLTLSYAQTASIRGIIFDEEQNPLAFANITTESSGTTSNENGFYELRIPANQKVKVTISYTGFKSIQATIQLSVNQSRELNFVMKTNVEQIGEITITNEKRTRVEGIITLEPAT
ncbi:MAG: carboxypeptidase-like regulatory domain-containing protein, partial [Psychroflexus sp.]